MSIETFGPMVTGVTVERAVEETLKTWQETYLAEIERQHDMTPRTLQPMRSWRTRNDLEGFPAEQLPACVIVSPGYTDEPQVEGDGSVTTFWELGVGVVSGGRDSESAARINRLHIAAFALALLHHPSLGGLAKGIVLRDMSHRDPDVEAHRTLSVAQATFDVEVPDSFNVRAGIISVPEDPYEDTGLVSIEDIQTNVAKEVD